MREAPVRVLHVLGSLDRGGAETWLVQLLEHLDRERVQTDVLVHRSGGVYEDHIREMNSEILVCGQLGRPLGYATTLRQLLQDREPYHIVHSHVQLYSGLVLRTAHAANVPGRIAHARNSQDGYRDTLFRLAYRCLMRYWIKRCATNLLAVSTEAAEGAFWKGVVESGRCQVLSGIDFSSFEAKIDRETVRSELAIPGAALVVGHVGSFRQQKNHQFLLAVAQRLVEFCPETIFVLIGEGRLRESIEWEVDVLGMRDHFRFLGERNDVPRLLRALDVFAFPSLYEGLPRALIEAQAAGIPCVASDSITHEASAGPDSVRFLSLAEGPWAWVRALVGCAQEPRSAIRGMEAIRHFEARGLGIAANARELTELYESIALIGSPTNY